MAEFTEDFNAPVLHVDDVQDQESTLTGVQDQEEEHVPQQDQHQEDVDQEQENTSAVVWIPKEDEQKPQKESSLTIQSEDNSNQFLMENFNFSFTSLLERTATPEEDFCRICHQRSLSEPNLSPCNCRGTMGLIHKSCLEKWLAASDSDKCELCHFNFTVKRQPKFGIMKAIKIWLQTEESRTERLHIILDIIRFTVSLPVILFFNHLTAVLFEIFHFDEVETCDIFSFLKNIESHLNISSMKDVVIITGRLLTYFFVGFTSALDVFAVGWFFSRIEEHYQHWHKWYRTQCIIHVVLPEGAKPDLENE